jgi:superfamily II DNA or RNA helicase
MIKPHPYQRDAIDGTVTEWKNGVRRTAIVMATGGGKTVVGSYVAKLCLDAGKQALVLAHRRELVDQWVDKLQQINPNMRVGLFQGPVKQWAANVVVASVATAVRPAALSMLRAADFGLIIVDETHHAVANSYVTILRELGAYEPGGPLVLGVTATMDRSDGLALSAVFESIAYKIGLIELIKLGFLVPPRGIRVRVAALDLDKVKTVAGDLSKGDTSRALHDSLAPAATVRAYLEHCPGVAAVSFHPSVAIAEEQADAFNAAGVPAACVTGETDDDLRKHLQREHRAGRILVLTNVDVFSEGTDMPYLRCVILGSPTKSAVKYTQQVGRGLRLFPGKSFCWILDVMGVTSKHRLATMANLDGADRVEDLPDELLMYEDELTPDDDLETQDQESRGSMLDDRDPGADGPLVHEMIDLFGASHAAWQATAGGVWFLATPRLFYYLRQADGADAGRYEIWYARRTAAIDFGPVPTATNLELGYAMAWGENLVEQAPHLQLDRDAKWRAGRPSSTLVFNAKALGIPLVRPMTRGELSDLVDQAEASLLFDKGFRGYRA